VDLVKFWVDLVKFWVDLVKFWVDLVKFWVDLVKSNGCDYSYNMKPDFSLRIGQTL